MTHTAAERISARQVNKFAVRRAELARAALQTLAELGYARTSLREIAHNTEFSHGVLHYYFSDKVDLITCCVKLYKAECVQRYDRVIAEAGSAAELRDGFADALTATLVADGPMHRLWYDLRTQAMFEDAFRADVAEIDASLQRMIWRIVCRHAELTGRVPVVTEETAYALLDGLFQHALIRCTAGDADAAGRLHAQVGPTLDSLL